LVWDLSGKTTHGNGAASAEGARSIPPDACRALTALIALSSALRNARLATIANALDSTVLPGLLRLYTGPRPAINEPVTEQMLLAEVRLSKPCAASLGGGVLTFAAIPRVLCHHSGTAAWARLLDGDERPVMDIDAGLPGSGVELELTRVDLLAGGAIDITLAELAE